MGKELTLQHISLVLDFRTFRILYKFSEELCTKIGDCRFNRPTEHNMANLLAEKKFRICKSSLLREHTVNQSFIALYRV